MNERAREQLEKLTPEKRAKVEAAMAKFRTPEYRAKEQASREAYDRESAETGTIANDSDAALALLSELAATLKARREAAGMSVEQVSALSGMDQSAIFKLERGENPNPTLRTLARYAAAIGGRLSVAIGDRPPSPA